MWRVPLRIRVRDENNEKRCSFNTLTVYSFASGD